MKSGTNQLHGSGFDYFVNTILNAGTPFTVSKSNPNENVRNPIHQNDYGFTLGGPFDSRSPAPIAGARCKLVLGGTRLNSMSKRASCMTKAVDVAKL
jgi:hypothetical protein